MVTMLVWTLVALVAAAVVLVLASVAEARADGPTGGVRGYLRDLRAGLRGLRADRAAGAPARPAPEVAVDTSIEELFAATELAGPAYLDVDDLTDALTRARERATRGVSGLARR